MSEEKEEKVNPGKKEQYEGFKVKIGTVGNFVFVAFILLILATAGLIYFLIHSEKENYDELVSNLNNVSLEEMVDDNTNNENSC